MVDANAPEYTTEQIRGLQEGRPCWDVATGGEPITIENASSLCERWHVTQARLFRVGEAINVVIPRDARAIMANYVKLVADIDSSIVGLRSNTVQPPGMDLSEWCCVLAEREARAKAMEKLRAGFVELQTRACHLWSGNLHRRNDENTLAPPLWPGVMDFFPSAADDAATSSAAAAAAPPLPNDLDDDRGDLDEAADDDADALDLDLEAAEAAAAVTDNVAPGAAAAAGADDAIVIDDDDADDPGAAALGELDELLPRDFATLAPGQWLNDEVRVGCVLSSRAPAPRALTPLRRSSQGTSSSSQGASQLSARPTASRRACTSSAPSSTRSCTS